MEIIPKRENGVWDQRGIEKQDLFQIIEGNMPNPTPHIC